jgi:hypothetical protein
VRLSPTLPPDNLQNNQSKKDYGSSGRVPALQAQSPKFNHQSQIKEQKEKRKESDTR